MIQTRKQLREYIDYETALYPTGFMRFFPMLVTEQQILRRHCILLRKAEFAYNTKRMLLYRFYLFFLSRLQNRYGLHIPINVFGKGLNINHTGLIVVNAHARVGEDCKLNAGTTIGENAGERPTLGNRVYIGPGVRIFGNVHIADDVKIGANAVVTHSCDVKGATLAGIPARIIQQPETEEQLRNTEE